MTVGGRIIENAPYQPKEGQPALRRLWVMDRDGTETAVLAEPDAVVLQPGEEIRWSGSVIYAKTHARQFAKIAAEFDPVNSGDKNG